MGLMQKMLGKADPATGRRTQADPRMKGAGRGRTTRATRGKVPPGRTRPAVGWGLRRKPKPKSRLQRLVSSVTGKS
jgi:hypothetical protein